MLAQENKNNALFIYSNIQMYIDLHVAYWNQKKTYQALGLGDEIIFLRWR